MTASMLNLIEVSGTALALGLGSWIVWKRTKCGPVTRICGAFMPLLLLLWLGECIAEWHVAPESRWNGARLAPSFALRLGEPLYPGPSNGVVLGNIYGPGMAFAYLPVTLAKRPSTAIWLGAVATSLFFFVPAALLMFAAAKNLKSSWLPPAGGFLVFAWFGLSVAPLRYVGFWIHADAPAIGCGLLACACVLRSMDSNLRWPLPLAAVLTVLAVWTKQTSAPILVAIPLCVLLTSGFKSLLKLIAMMALVCVGLAAVTLLVTNPGDIWFNLITVPSRHPWLADVRHPEVWMTSASLGGRIAAMLTAAKELWQCVWVLLLIVAGQGCLRLAVHRRAGLETPLYSDCWLPPLIVAVCMLPTALMGRVKVGGDINSLGYVAAFLAATVALIALHWLRRCEALTFGSRAKRVAILTAMACCGLIWQLQTVRRFDNARVLSRVPDLQDKAVDYVKSHPGEIYFPWHPLVHLMGEQRACHFFYGVFDRDLAGFPLDIQHYLEGLPKHLQGVALNESTDTSSFQNWLPEFTNRTQLPELPGWTIYGATEIPGPQPPRRVD